MRQQAREWFLTLFGPVLLLVAWHLVSTVFNYRPTLLPTPQQTVGKLFSLFFSGEFIPDLIASGRRWFTGYLLGSISGLAIGSVMGLSGSIRKILEFPIEFGRAIPVTAMFPLFLLTFGIEDASKVAMVFTATIFIVAINSSQGVRNTRLTRIRMAHSFGASHLQTFYHVVLLDALPYITLGLRTAFSLSLIVEVVSEMFIGTDHGLGQRVFDAYSRNSITELYATVLLLGLIGYGGNKMFITAERKLFHWTGK